METAEKIKTVLVTGSAGFIGRHLVPLLRERGYKVLGIDRRGEDHLKHDEKADGFIRDDYLNVRNLDTTDAVIHLAADASVQYSLEKPLITHKNNVSGVLQLLHLASKNDIKKFIFASSCAIYGNPLDDQADERAEKHPESFYGNQKLAAENYVWLAYKLLGLPTTTLRLFNVFGESQSEENAGVVTKFLKAKKELKKYKVYGDGQQTRCYVYVKDVAEAFVRALEADYTGAFNIASPEPISVKEIVEVVGGEFEYLAELPGEIKHIEANVDMAKKYLGWEPKVKLLDWIKEQS